MTSSHSLVATTTQNPSPFSPRYEIRRLTPSEAQWAAAIFMHSNIFYGTLLPAAYPVGQGKRFNEAIPACSYLLDHQIDSGLSFGVFDLEYKYKRPESAASNGKFSWDPSNNNVTGEELIQQMDFPLVTIALAYDGINALDPQRIGPLINIFPFFMDIYIRLRELDKRDPASWEPTAAGQMLMRNGTSTRHDYEGHKLMSGLARWLMREAALRGFRGAQIECAADAVTKVWSEPPAPFKGSVVSEFQTNEYETTNENGERTNPFGQAKQRVTKVYVTLAA